MAHRALVVFLVSACVALGGNPAALAYPTDDYERTGIRRLKWQYEVDFKGRRGRKMVPGGRWPAKQIQLRMRDVGRDFELTAETPKDPQLQEALEKVLKTGRWRRYNVAILDITDPSKPRYAGVNEHASQTPGSVAKVVCAAGMLELLKQRFPDDIAKREELLRTHEVSADDWARSDSHTVPFVYGDHGEKIVHKKIRTGDTFTLWEWMDHALSASNNSAASTLWREATLMKLLGNDYPPEKYGKELWAKWDREAMTEASFDVVNKPLIDAGIDPEEFRLRLYFTTGANRYIRPKSSGATPFSLIQWMVRVEQGRMVDEFSSLELKRMLYLTRRRVRYFYTKKLNEFGAFFKTGSLYRFSENAERIQYQGDLINVLNALVEVDTSPPIEPVVETVTEEAGTAKAKPEAVAKPPPLEIDAITGPPPQADKPREPANEPPTIYIVAVMSNELLRNAALDHSKLAAAIHEIVTAPVTTKAEPSAP
ncbi:MAG: hypothetical protein V3T05_02955 [Myxococcota bacterium]